MAVEIEKVKLGSSRSKCSLISLTAVLAMYATAIRANWTKIIFKRPCQTTVQKKNLTKLSNLASVCDRFYVSNYAAAAIASATLVDHGIITKVNSSQIIGPQKLGDERRRCREERREEELGTLKKLTFLYFDGKKSMTRVFAKNNKTKRWSPRMKVQ